MIGKTNAVAGGGDDLVKPVVIKDYVWVSGTISDTNTRQYYAIDKYSSSGPGYLTGNVCVRTTSKYIGGRGGYAGSMSYYGLTVTNEEMNRALTELGFSELEDGNYTFNAWTYTSASWSTSNVRYLPCSITFDILDGVITCEKETMHLHRGTSGTTGDADSVAMAPYYIFKNS